MCQRERLEQVRFQRLLTHDTRFALDIAKQTEEKESKLWSETK